MSSKPRTKEHFPKAKIRGGRRRNYQRKSQQWTALKWYSAFDMAWVERIFEGFTIGMAKFAKAVLQVAELAPYQVRVLEAYSEGGTPVKEVGTTPTVQWTDELTT